MIPIELPPGVYSAPTKASKSGNWRETHLIRWVGGRMTPIRGWSRLNYGLFASPVRAIHSWLDNDGQKYTAYLCEQHCYVDIGGERFDITPAGGMEPPINPGDGGYGDGAYGTDTYGTPRTGIDRQNPIPPVFTADNWGEQLLVMTSADSRLLYWDPSIDDPQLTPLQVVPDAPAGRTFVVTPERHVMVFGMEGISRRFGWSDKEDYSNWDFADVTSQAGFFDVEPSSPIVSARQTQDGVVFHTAVNAFVVRYIGQPLVYNYEDIGSGNTPISGQAIIDFAMGSVWMADSGFWRFDGTSVVPVQCPVWSWVNEKRDPILSRYLTASVDIATKSEVWFFFPSKDAATNDLYALWNYREDWWSMGYLGRTAAFSASYDSFPIMSDGNSIYQHEDGFSYPGAEKPWAETFAINVASGDPIITVDQMLPDIEGNADTILFDFFYKDDRSRGPYKSAQNFAIRDNGYVDIRRTGRDFRMRVKSVGAVSDWTMGQTKMEIKVRGKR